MGSKPLRIRLYKIDGSIKIYDRIKYLALFNNHFTFDWICDKIKYLISEKSSITDVLIILMLESESIQVILYL